VQAGATGGDVLSAAWCTHRFDHLAPELADQLHETLATMRGVCPVAHSEQHGGFWIITKHEDVVRVAQDWESFSSELGITVPGGPSPIPAIPEMVDPPLHREYKRLINAFFTPHAVLEHEDATRRLVNGLIDEFIESGTCDFMDDFSRPLPGLVFFEQFLHAPAEELAEVNRLATVASVPTTAEGREARGAMLRWIGAFAEARRAERPRGDVVDAILQAEIEGRPITDLEVVGMLQLLLFGGLDTTAGALGQMMIRLCQEPAIVDLLRDHPERTTDAIEELLRLDGPFIFIGRTATRDTEVGGQLIKEGDRVLLSWVSANRDADEFDGPDGFDLDRRSNRHVAFGAGPHRCAGSHLARMNLRVALTEVLRRMSDIRLQDEAAPIAFHSMYNRAPVAVPITFTPGPREA
jgi:cytochrome P450